MHLVNFLQKNVVEAAQEQKVNIVLFSDGCTYQNRNLTLFNALLNLSLLFRSYYYTEIFATRSCYGQMEVDHIRVH